jgi:hypothetical protein
VFLRLGAIAVVPVEIHAEMYTQMGVRSRPLQRSIRDGGDLRWEGGGLPGRSREARAGRRGARRAAGVVPSRRPARAGERGWAREVSEGGYGE